MIHTPGPWVADDNSGLGKWSIWQGAVPRWNEALLVAVALVAGDNAEAERNARLIAAAPDLLRAAKNFVQWFECDRIGSKPIAELEDALSAIARAEGSQT